MESFDLLGGNEMPSAPLTFLLHRLHRVAIRFFKSPLPGLAGISGPRVALGHKRYIYVFGIAHCYQTLILYISYREKVQGHRTGAEGIGASAKL